MHLKFAGIMEGVCDCDDEAVANVPLDKNLTDLRFPQ